MEMVSLQSGNVCAFYPSMTGPELIRFKFAGPWAVESPGKLVIQPCPLFSTWGQKQFLSNYI